MWIVTLLGGWRGTAFAILALLALAGTGIQTMRLDAAQRDVANEKATMQAHLAADAEAARLAEVAARTKEYEHAAAAAKVAAQYEKDKRNAKAQSDRVIADLRAGNLRLQSRWSACQASSGVSQAGVAAAGTDAATDDCAASIGRVLTAARQCEAQVIGLQALVLEDRK